MTPDDEFNRRIGLEYMNSAKRLEAAELGYRQGAGEAARLRTLWG